MEFEPNSNILASAKTVWNNCLTVALFIPSATLFVSREDKCEDKKNDE